jgi:hypothetical protein
MSLDGFLIESRRVVIAKPVGSWVGSTSLGVPASDPTGFFIESRRVFGRVVGWEHVPLNAVS